MEIIALEEHIVTTEVIQAWRKLEPKWQDLSLKGASEGEIARRLLDLGPNRLAAMDASGVDVQVLSLTTPGVQSLEINEAKRLQIQVNDLLAETVRTYPDRFQAFATLATPDPKAAALELERAVTKLGLIGAMPFGRTREKNMDHPDFWPIYEAAEALGAPLYIHPQSPQLQVREAYYDGFGAEISNLFAIGGLGWHYETGIQFIRLVLSGVLDRYPKLQLILGHWGEVVLFYLERVDDILGSSAKLPRRFSDYVRDQVHVAPSGIFSQRYLRWATEVVGIDRILFSVDYPFLQVPDGGAPRFLVEANLSDIDRAKIANGNWRKLVANIKRLANVTSEVGG